MRPDPASSIPRLDHVGLRHSSFGSDAAAARFATILIELGIGNPSDWSGCGQEPAKFLRRTLDRFVERHAEAAIDGAFELSVTLSTDPHEWCETEDEPDGSQMFLYMEAGSCGFVNLGPALALCEKEHPRLPVTFARLFLHGLGRCFRIYDDRDAEEHLSFLEDNYDPEEGREALPDRKKHLAAVHEPAAIGRRGVESNTGPDGAEESSIASAQRNARSWIGYRAVSDFRRSRNQSGKCSAIAISQFPILLAIYQQGDAIEACFDDESQSMLELDARTVAVDSV